MRMGGIRAPPPLYPSDIPETNPKQTEASCQLEQGKGLAICGGIWGRGGAAWQRESIMSPIKVVKIHLLTRPPSEIDIY